MIELGIMATPKYMVLIRRIKDITVSATGKVKGKTFETETKSIKADKLTDNTDVTVSFDDDDISDYIEKRKKITR